MRKFWKLILMVLLGLTLSLGATTMAVAQSSTAASAPKSSKTSAENAEKLDINSATKEQLDALPGIDEAYAQKSSPDGCIGRSAT